VSALVVHAQLQYVSVLLVSVVNVILSRLTFSAVGRESVFGLESLIWFKKVPELLDVSRM